MKINNKNQKMKPFFDELDAEVSANVAAFKAAIEKGRFRFSPSGLKTLLDDPLSFLKQYVCGEFDDSSTKSQIRGSLIHTLLMEPELFDEEYIVTEEGKATPSESIQGVLKYLASLGLESYVLDDYKKEIIDYLKEINLYQSLVDDKKDPSLTKEVKQLEKVIDDTSRTYFDSLMQGRGKTIITQEQKEAAEHKVKMLKMANNFSKIIVEEGKEDFQDVIYELELEFNDPRLEIPGKCIIDVLKVDQEAKKFIITDVKTTANDLGNWLKFDTEKFKVGIQIAFNVMAVKENFINGNEDYEDYKVEFNFALIDGKSQCYIVPVSEATIDRYISETIQYINTNAVYHIENMDFRAPFDFLKENVIL